MAQCPACGFAIQEDFGVVTCAQCGSVLVIDIDGEARMNGGAADRDAGGLPDSGGAPQTFESPFVDANPSDAIVEPVIEFSNPDPDDDPFANENPHGTEWDAADDPAPAAMEAPGDGGEGVSGDVDIVFDDPLPQVEPTRAATVSPDSLAADLTRFANSDQAAGREGLLKYDIMIEGIDTADIRTELKEALTDRKFIWDAEGLIRTIKNGRLELKGLSAVKAVVLVQRIRYLPLKIQWEQHAVFED